MLEKQEKRHKRHKRVRARISGSSERPRLCVFKSNKYIYAQLIDDEKGKVLLSVDDRKLKKPAKPLKEKETGKVLTTKVAKAFEVGKLIAKKAKEKKIEKVVFDRGGYKYHGRVKALAEGAREGGLKF